MTPLRERMQHDMLIRSLAENTQKSYLQQVSSFARHFRRSPELLGPEEIRAWLVYLREERRLAPGSLGPTIGALRFLYRVTLKRDWSDEDFPLRKSRRGCRSFLSHDEITTFFESVASLKQRTILMTAYAAGLRVSEVVHLKVTDIDSQRMVIRVNQGTVRSLSIHVVPAGNELAVQTEGGEGRTMFFTLEKAIAIATERARRHKVELLVHGRDWQIRSRISFVPGPPAIKG